MKKITSITITFFSLLTLIGQNGLKEGNLFILQYDKQTISINTFVKNKIKVLKIFSVTEKSIYTTDQKARVAILNLVKKEVTLFDIYSSNQIKLTIPFKIAPKSILLNNDNLFLGGEVGKEILLQYNIKYEIWHQLEIPAEIMVFGKAIDDLVVNDSMLIAIDNIIMPKYILFYNINPIGKLNLSHYKELKTNGSYEGIYHGRITDKYLGLLSGTFSGWVGSTNHITIYDNIELTSSFAISSRQKDSNSQTYTDFLIINDKVIIACKEKGLGIIEIKDTFFKSTDKYNNNRFNVQVNSSIIKYTSYNCEIIKLTLIPNTEKVILSFEDKKGKIRHNVIKI